MRDNTLPLSGKVVHGFGGVIAAQAGDEQRFAVFEARWFELQGLRGFCGCASHCYPPVWWQEMAWSVCPSHLQNASYKFLLIQLPPRKAIPKRRSGCPLNA